MRRILVLLLIVLVTTLSAHAQQTPQKFVQETDYLLSLPDGYAQDTTLRWPLLIFLHGSGERGDDLNKVKVHGPPKLAAAGKKFPFIIISPQAKEGGGWNDEQLYQLIRSVQKGYRVDRDRIYLTGLSMGGYGTWSLAAKHPEMFAAIAPICGGGDPAETWKLRNMPIWCFHGALDNVVPLRASQQMVDGAKLYNPNVRFTIYPDANHDSWTVTYNNDSLYQWFLQHRKFAYREVKLDSPIMKEMVGRYTDDRKDTITLFFAEGKLRVKTGGKNSMEVKPASADLYFLQPNDAVDVAVIRNKKGAVSGFYVRADKIRYYGKLK